MIIFELDEFKTQFFATTLTTIKDKKSLITSHIARWRQFWLLGLGFNFVLIAGRRKVTWKNVSLLINYYVVLNNLSREIGTIKISNYTWKTRIAPQRLEIGLSCFFNTDWSASFVNEEDELLAATWQHCLSRCCDFIIGRHVLPRSLLLVYFLSSFLRPKLILLSFRWRFFPRSNGEQKLKHLRIEYFFSRKQFAPSYISNSDNEQRKFVIQELCQYTAEEKLL